MGQPEGLDRASDDASDRAPGGASDRALDDASDHASSGAPDRASGGASGPVPDHAAIDVRSVAKAFETAAGVFHALRGIDLQVGRGEFVAVVGKSGSGKSTLVNMIAGIDRPTEGEVYVAGTPVHTLSENQLARWRGANVGVVFQFFQLLPTLTVVENVMLPMDFCSFNPPGGRKKRALGLLADVGLMPHADKLPLAISGGEQQRVAIARALANDPPIVLADEPTGNLDSKTSASVFELFGRLVAQGKTILMVTHDRDLAHSVTRSVMLADGRIVEETRPVPVAGASVGDAGRAQHG